MALYDYGELNNMHVDILREIANIGTGNAATSLASMLQRPINIEVPRVSFLDYQAVTESLGGPETLMVGMMLTLHRDVSGMMMFLMKEEFAHMVLNSLLGQSFASFTEVDEMSLSAMQEIGNIMAGSYVNAISQITGLAIEISPPDITIDMIGSILSVPAIHFANISDQVIFIEDEFDGGSGNKDEASNILLIPDVDSLEKILEKLGAGL
ncbi:chemotaxis protein CheC [Ruminococcaceae bacterium OttesenSCG-928-O06]|nr:chemotaxis protein CheC [Ruminococcaceae bacterium OttesenSCG-928-O06]